MYADALTAYWPDTHGAMFAVFAKRSFCTTSELVRGLPGMGGVEWITSCPMLIRATLPVQVVSAVKIRFPVV